MGKSDLDNEVMKLKKAKVIEVVERACKEHGLPLPNINFEGCPQEGGLNEYGHYHPDKNQICISERQLRKQDLDGVERTALHEVTHILVLDHGPDFKQKNMDIVIKSWVPPPGVAFIRGGTDDDPTISIKEVKQKKGECAYHLCHKRTRLTECPYCKEKYCAEHTSPFRPRYAATPGISEEGHPCIGYHKVQEEENKRLGDVIERAYARRNAKKAGTKPLEEEHMGWSGGIRALLLFVAFGLIAIILSLFFELLVAVLLSVVAIVGIVLIEKYVIR